MCQTDLARAEAADAPILDGGPADELAGSTCFAVARETSVNSKDLISILQYRSRCPASCCICTSTIYAAEPVEILQAERQTDPVCQSVLTPLPFATFVYFTTTEANAE